MEQQVIEVERRTESGKGASRKTRKTGRIPGIVYGHKQEAQSITLDPVALRKAIKHSGAGRNTVFQVKGLDREVMALLKDAQIHPVRREIVHVDFVEIRESDRVVVEVPVELIGKPEGVVAGGVLQAVRRSVAVEVSPLRIPKVIQVDVTHLQMNQAVHISDIKFPEGTKSASSGNFAVATVQAPKAEVVETAAPVEGAEGVEGAAAAEGAEGAAGAAESSAPERKVEKKGDKR